MKRVKKQSRFKLLIFAVMFLTIILLYLSRLSYSAPISWSDERAYRPYPVLFLHGFAGGSPDSWEAADGHLAGYFDSYYDAYRLGEISSLLNGVPLTRNHSYLEKIYFFDPTSNYRSTWVDRNGSLDSYQYGDTYVTSGDKFPGDNGWSDIVAKVVPSILSAYNTDKIVIVTHSAGGLAVREYFRTDNGYFNASKLITIGTAHKGSYLADLAKSIKITQKTGWFVPVSGWAQASEIEILDGILNFSAWIDLDGDSARDQTPESQFLSRLNSSGQPFSVEYLAVAGKWGFDRSLGDGVVSLDSQLGVGVLNFEEQININAFHAVETTKVTQSQLVDGEFLSSPLLRLIDNTIPELEINLGYQNNTIPLSNLNASPVQVKNVGVIFTGFVHNENLPADSVLDITICKGTNFEDIVAIRSFKLFASSEWSSTDRTRKVAEIKASTDILRELPSPGEYTIVAKVTNPAGFCSDKKMLKINFITNVPIIKLISYSSLHVLSPIQVKIWSPEGYDMDLGSISMQLNDIDVGYDVTLNPSASSLLITHTPTDPAKIIMSLPGYPSPSYPEGHNKLVVKAKDIYGQSAESFTLYFIPYGNIVSQINVVGVKQDRQTLTAGNNADINLALLAYSAAKASAPIFTTASSPPSVKQSLSWNTTIDANNVTYSTGLAQITRLFVSFETFNFEKSIPHPDELRVYKAFISVGTTDVIGDRYSSGEYITDVGVAQCQSTSAPYTPDWNSAYLVGTLPANSRLVSLELDPNSINLNGYTQFCICTQNDINGYHPSIQRNNGVFGAGLEVRSDVDAELHVYFY